MSGGGGDRLDGIGCAAALLARIERAGNALPHPVTLFAAALLLIMLLSQLAVWAGWSAIPPGAEGNAAPLAARSLFDADGLWWLLSGLVRNFTAFPPLGIVLVAMLGIGVAERSGLLAAIIARVLLVAGARALTPAVVLLGILSSIAVDAGYVVIPPLAAALFHAAGRPPLAGIAAAFAGVAAGFSANLVITGIDPLLAGFTESAARIVDPDYRVAVTANWGLMAVSTLVLTGAGWWVTSRWVEPRLRDAPITVPQGVADSGDPVQERRGLRAATLALVLMLVGVSALVFIPGAPLHGMGERFPRWVEAMIPVLMLCFLVPGLAYGIVSGTIRSDRDAMRMLTATIADLAPYIVLAFVAAQFIAAFDYSRLGILLAIHAGERLAALQPEPALLVLVFVLMAMMVNLFMASASAKYAFFAPVFVPMLMLAGIAPELTQAAYRIGDSVTNIITPLNPYWVILLAVVQRWMPAAGAGTLMALMLPYALVFALLWPILLSLWVAAGIPLGPGGHLSWP
ncbi:MAG: AbgT family transporter [Gammaproteobacteria bacterium]|nr:AbgT family transporter [Gammaproteobacteria bacterium]